MARVRSKRIIRGLGAGVLLWLSWLLSFGVACAQEVLPAAALRAAPAPLPIRLSPQPKDFISLDGRSRYWIDVGGVRTAEQLEAAGDTIAWALREPGHRYRIDGKALWFQFDAVSEGEKQWFIELASAGIDRAQLYYRLADGSWREQEAGDGQAMSQWPVPGRFPTFELARGNDKPLRYWLRVEHERVDFASPIAIYDRAALLTSREREQFLLGAYFGLAALIALVAAANGVVYRDRSFAVYAVFVVTLAAGQLASLGIGAQHLWSSWLKANEIAAFLLPGISAAAALWFARMVTEPARYSKALDLAVWSLIAAILSAAALDTVLTSRDSLALVIGLIAVALVVIAGLVALVWTQGEDPDIHLIALGFLPLLLTALFPLARALNLLPSGLLTQYGQPLGTALAMPVLFYALSLRGGRRREAQVRTAALSHNDPLTGLAHARTLTQRLDSALVRSRALKHDCALLAVKVSNLDGVSAEFGRETADRALVVTASLLRHAISDIDLAARVGEHEFALLLEGPTTTEIALSRAQQVVASGLRSSAALPPGTALKFHVAVALLPDRDLDARSTIKWLVDGVNAIPAEARKLIRPLNF